MAEAGCYTQDCHFLGSAGHSDAQPGPCTQTAGYLANAEIKGIMKNSSRVTKSFVDGPSNSNILVYDETQWVSYMDSSIRSSRESIYKGLNMGGTTNWALDLEDYHNPPEGVSSWLHFVTDLAIGGNPYARGTRTGNWTSLTCSNPAVENAAQLTPQERWDQLDCPDAWSNGITTWENDYRDKTDESFSVALGHFYYSAGGEECGSMAANSGCTGSSHCGRHNHAGSGPAGWFIWEALKRTSEVS